MEWSRCWIGLGGNLGDVSATFDQALNLLDQESLVDFLRESSRFGTAPIGGSAGDAPRYLNSVAELSIACSLPELLQILQRVEKLAGRERTAYWGARRLDLDLLLHESETSSSPELTVPHPHLWYRRFVLDPLVELAPDVIHPDRHASIAQLRDRLLLRPLTCGIYGGEEATRETITRNLTREFVNVEIQAREIVPTGVAETFSLWLGPETGNRRKSVDFIDLPQLSRFDLGQIPLPAEDAIRQMLRAALDI